MQTKRREPKAKPPIEAVRIADGHYRVTSATETLGYYDVRMTPRGWRCTCAGYFWRGTCTHVRLVASLDENSIASS